MKSSCEITDFSRAYFDVAQNFMIFYWKTNLCRITAASLLVRHRGKLLPEDVTLMPCLENHPIHEVTFML